MATPVPVVSIMYFFESIPPNTLRIVSPAFSAISTKLAAGSGVFPLVDCALISAVDADRTRPMSKSCRYEKKKRRTPGGIHILVSDTRERYLVPSSDGGRSTPLPSGARQRIRELLPFHSAVAQDIWPLRRLLETQSALPE